MKKMYKVKANKGYYVATELNELNLEALTNPGMLGKDAFSMVIFKTESGAVYKIYEKADFNSARVDFMIKKRGWRDKEYHLSCNNLEKMRIRKGESFIYPNGSTTPVTLIYGVCARSVWLTSDYPELIIPNF